MQRFLPHHCYRFFQIVYDIVIMAQVSGSRHNPFDSTPTKHMAAKNIATVEVIREFTGRCCAEAEAATEARHSSRSV